ncbi:hypothetical protein MBIO_0617 [Mycoplasmopsis fermentans PG18]|uniref:C4-dicarboxylate transporter/malic acid transport protein n=2 Tax=Mycoplasmopsis fermentans TaxID=2115 RepID=C4XFG0_MYCFP|nr:hypothetical protein [Mycoplasmopsis fermentans]ADV34819.1 Hypothetical Protein MfeM64YM_0824 [Mycoplasmopsis fermentans M64]BAH69882.1 hypothetical protein MBIO_0617 [Mycoplasmopsis fermentans PG18]VEU63721.1 C4-dicarboxylate transporter/malic acid transport protein [Mycoplasmopsis fermentans]VEU67290.1 C4-dicarboxylate transporter/malic acid transport protein [Mesomycoplasma conjunctivae]
MTFKNKLEKVPLGLGGLALGISGLAGAYNGAFNEFKNSSNGKLINNVSIGIQAFWMLIAFALAFIVCLRFIKARHVFNKEAKAPNTAAFIPTLLMTFISIFTFIASILNTYLEASEAKKWLYIPLVFSFIAFILQIAYLITFIVLIIVQHDFKYDEAFASWFIPTVGFVILTFGANNYQNIIPLLFYQILWFIGLLFCFLIFILVAFKVAFVGHKNHQDIPSLAIFCAPAMVLSFAFLTLFDPKNPNANILNNYVILYTFTGILFLFILVGWAAYFYSLAISIKSKKFYFTWACFTFPIEISSTALFKYAQVVFTKDLNVYVHFAFIILAILFLIFATVIINYVFYKYVVGLHKIFSDKDKNNSDIQNQKTIVEGIEVTKVDLDSLE